MTPARTTCTWVTAYRPAVLGGWQGIGVCGGTGFPPCFGAAACGVGSLLRSGYGVDVLREQIPSNGRSKREPVCVQKGDWSAS